MRGIVVVCLVLVCCIGVGESKKKKDKGGRRGHRGPPDRETATQEDIRDLQEQIDELKRDFRDIESTGVHIHMHDGHKHRGHGDDDDDTDIHSESMDGHGHLTHDRHGRQRPHHRPGRRHDDHAHHHNRSGAHVHMHMHLEQECGHSGDEDSHSHDADDYAHAHCHVTANPSGTVANSINGYIHIRQKHGEDIQVLLHLSGFDPSGDRSHGMHVHEFGDMSDGCQSLGGHLNPHKKHHGSPDSDERHEGDWGNIEVDDSGDVHKMFEDDEATLFGSHTIVGRSIVIHHHADDLGQGGDDGSLRTGNAGARLACCVIGWSGPHDWDPSASGHSHK